MTHETRQPAETFPIWTFIAEELRARSWGIADLAEESGLSVETLERLMGSLDDSATARVWAGLARAFGTSGEFWERIDAAHRPPEPPPTVVDRLDQYAGEGADRLFELSRDDAWTIAYVLRLFGDARNEPVRNIGSGAVACIACRMHGRLPRVPHATDCPYRVTRRLLGHDPRLETRGRSSEAATGAARPGDHEGGGAMMVFGVTGSRDATSDAHRKFISRVIELYTSPEVDALIHGACVGADEAAAIAAADRGLRWIVAVVPPNRRLVSAEAILASDEVIEIPGGLGGYKRRNQAIVDRADALLAFPRHPEDHPRSRGSGTWQTIRMARRAGIPVYEHPLPDHPGPGAGGRDHD